MQGCAMVVLILSVAAMLMPLPARAGEPAQAAARRAAHAGQQTGSSPPPVDLLWRTEESDRLFSLVGLNLGLDRAGEPTFEGRGRLFVRFGGRSAFQIEGTYDRYQDHRDGQLDFGLANRVKRVQIGLSSSIRYVALDAYDHGVSVSQFGAALDYVFRTARVGVFGAAGLQDTEGLGLPRSAGDVSVEGSLRLIDQFGVSAQVDVLNRAQLAGHLSFLDPVCQGRTTAGAIRLVYPMTDDWALTAEGAWNPSLVGRSTQARFIVGAQMGRWPLPRTPLSDDRAVPASMSPIRYQVSRAAAQC